MKKIVEGDFNKMIVMILVLVQCACAWENSKENPFLLVASLIIISGQHCHLTTTHFVDILVGFELESSSG